MNYITGDDLIFYKDSNTGNIMSGGYIVDSILLKEGINPITTLNSRKSIDNYESENDLKYGGSNEDQVSSIFKNLAIPAGIYFHNQKSGLNNNNNNNNIDFENNYNHSKPLSEDIHEKLYKLVEIQSAKKYTRKNKNNKDNKDKIKSNKKSRKNIE
jgi:hypothetical protein